MHIRSYPVMKLVVLFAVVVTGSASATVVVPLSMDETMRQANAIVSGTVTSQHSRWGDVARTWMVTDYTLSVDDVLYTADGAPTIAANIVLTYWGGTIGDETQAISDMQRPSVGEQL